MGSAVEDSPPESACFEHPGEQISEITELQTSEVQMSELWTLSTAIPASTTLPLVGIDQMKNPVWYRAGWQEPAAGSTSQPSCAIRAGVWVRKA